MGERVEKHGRLEIDEHYDHHVRGWRIKRVAWAFMAALIVAALCGFVGPGPFSKTSAQGAGMRIEYERIVRYNAPVHVTVEVPGGNEDLELSLPSAFIKNIDLERIDPEPKEMRLDGDKHTWIFPRRDQKSELMISYRPQTFGKKRIRFEVKGAGALEIQQLILP